MGVLIGTRSFREKLSHAWTGIRNPQPTTSLTQTSPRPSIGLHARRQNGDLELTWNRESELVIAATSGVISIEDGGLKLQIPLNSTQIRDGSVLYGPLTDQIRMQFTITTPEHAVTESVMVLLPKVGAPRTQPLEASITAVQIPRPNPPSDNISRLETAKPFTVPSTPQRPLPTPAVAPDAPPVPTTNPNPNLAVFPLVVSQTPPPPPPPLPGPGPQAVVQQPASVAAAPVQQTAAHLRPSFQSSVAIAEVRPRFPSELKSVVVSNL